jgi:hypothetical protein
MSSSSSSLAADPGTTIGLRRATGTRIEAQFFSTLVLARALKPAMGALTSATRWGCRQR